MKKELQKSLVFLKVNELKYVCEKLQLSLKGKKGELIERIVVFVTTGKNQAPKKLPQASCASKGVLYPLKPDTLILKGSYKNDEATRLFFKRLIGEHFHFTAFGQDWIKERWLKGRPPTYKEFANFWQKEYEARKNKKAEPKEEWAFLNFTQRFLERNPKAERSEIAKEWEKERKKQVAKAFQLLGIIWKKELMA